MLLFTQLRLHENEFQRFFEQHPDFLTGISYQEVHPQLVLASDENKELIPDFFLEPLAAEFCDILEVKLPYSRLVRRFQHGRRTHFTALVTEAIAQLSDYQRWFDDRNNRRNFHNRYGLASASPLRELLQENGTHPTRGLSILVAPVTARKYKRIL